MKDFISAKGAGHGPRDAGVRDRTRPSSRVWRLAAAALLLAAVVGGASLAAKWHGGATAPIPARHEEPAKKHVPGKSRVLPRASAAAPVEVEPAATTNAAAGAKPPKETFGGQEVLSHTYRTNETGRSVREIIVTADGRRHGKTTVIAKPTFRHGTDQLLADVLFPPEHGSPAPLPELDAKALDKEFARSMLDPIEVLDTDSEETRLKKEAVRQARHEVLALIKEGHTLLDIIRSQREENERAHDLRLDVARELQRMRREGAGAGEMREFLEKANQELGRRGVGPVAEPRPGERKRR